MRVIKATGQPRLQPRHAPQIRLATAMLAMTASTSSAPAPGWQAARALCCCLSRIAAWQDRHFGPAPRLAACDSARRRCRCARDAVALAACRSPCGLAPGIRCPQQNQHTQEPMNDALVPAQKPPFPAFFTALTPI